MSLTSLLSLPLRVLENPVGLLPRRSRRGDSYSEQTNASAEAPAPPRLLYLVPESADSAAAGAASRPEPILRPHRREPLTSHAEPDQNCAIEWTWRPRPCSSPFDTLKNRRNQRLRREPLPPLRPRTGRPRMTSSANRRPKT